MADYLEELIKDTPMGRIKLLAAWDALSSETHIRLLMDMRSKGRTRASDRLILLKALSSPSEYVRYLAARRIGYLQDEEIENKVIADVSPLVRYSQAMGTLLRELSCEDFNQCPRELKLAIVSDGTDLQTTKLASWVEWAVETKRASDAEIYDVLLEYLSNSEALRWLQESSYDHFGDTESEKGFKALWDLVSKVPSQVAHCLVALLPWRNVFGDEPPSETLSWLRTSPHLDALLWREDVPLIEVRRRVFFSNDPKSKDLMYSAVSHHFWFAPEELTELFRRKSDRLDILAAFCDFAATGPAAEWVPFTALVLKDSAWARESGRFLIDEGKLEQKFKSSLAQLQGETREKGLRLLRIYSLAKKVVCWEENLLKNEQFEPDLGALPEQFGFLAEKIVSGDTWGTFVGFAKAIDWRFDRFDHLLPHLEGLSPAEESTAPVIERDGLEQSLHKQGPTGANTQPAPASQAPRGRLFGNTIVVLGIAAALLTILFAIGGILDNEYRNFGSGLIALAISAGVVALAGVCVRRDAEPRNR